MQAGHPKISNVNTQKWGLISELELASFRWISAVPCNHLLWTWQDECAEANLNSAGVKLGGWQATHLETYHYDVIYSILAHYSIRNFELGKQSKAPTVFSTYVNSVKCSTLHF